MVVGTPWSNMAQETDDIEAEVENDYTLAAVACNHSHGSIRTPHLGGQLHFPDGRTGLKVHQDAAEIAVTAGTLNNHGDEPEMYSYQTLNPEGARKLAWALWAAAEKTEAELAALDQTGLEEKSTPGLLRRLIE